MPAGRKCLKKSLDSNTSIGAVTSGGHRYVTALQMISYLFLLERLLVTKIAELNLFKTLSVVKKIIIINLGALKSYKLVKR
jgi:hypothetical protein